MSGAEELQPEPEREPGSAGQLTRPTQQQQNPDLHATLEKAREVERRIQERQLGRKNTEMTKYSLPQAITCIPHHG